MMGVMNTWTWTWAIRNFTAELLMPPGIWIVLGLLTLWLFRNHRRVQIISIIFSFVMIWATSTTGFALWLTQSTASIMKWPTPVEMKQLVVNDPAQSAIVILGGGRRKGAIEVPEYGNDDVSKETMERIRLGARLAKKTKLPILVTGGAPDAIAGKNSSEAQIMSLVLKNEFDIKVKWIENKSTTTQENAKFSSKFLHEGGIKKIYLVTHFWHMPRSVSIFEKQGFEVIPIPGAYLHANQLILKELTPLDFYPNDLNRVRQIWHEILGIARDQIRYETLLH